MNINKKLSCVIVGEGSLPIVCIELLLKNGYEIRGIVSSDVLLMKWAASKNIPYVAVVSSLKGILNGKPYDYLFSIVNSQILSKAILATPRKYAINYHDGPLPRYAGTNVTSWALMAGEVEYAVTWHLITEQVDAGDILCQVPIEISSGETSLTLNLKCFDAAQLAFSEIIDRISGDEIVAYPQVLASRTFFARTKRPYAACLIDWNFCAKALDAQFRALEFGSYANPLGIPKISIGREFFLVKKLHVLDSQSEQKAGLIILIETDFLRISTATYDVQISNISTMRGIPVSIDSLLRAANLGLGDSMSVISEADSALLHSSYCRAAESEAAWVNQLSHFQPTTLPWGSKQYHKHQYYECHTWKIPSEILIDSRTKNWDCVSELLAIFAIYIARVSGVSRVDVGLKNLELCQRVGKFSGVFSNMVPLQIEVDMQTELDCVIKTVENKLANATQQGTFVKDIFVRYPKLSDILDCPIIVEIVPSSVHSFSASCTVENDFLSYNPELIFQLAEDGTFCNWVYSKDSLKASTVERIAAHFAILLTNVLANPSVPIYTLPLLSKNETDYLLNTLNATQVAYPKDKCIHELFEEQAKKTPSNIAVVFEQEELTYEELNVKANRLAHYLREQGVQADSLVGLCVDRSLDMIVGLLGILKAGGAYVPLDPSYPENRLAYMIKNSRLALMLTQESLSDKVGDLIQHAKDYAQLKSVSLNNTNIQRALLDRPYCNPEGDGKTSHKLAYVIYTSGSTGLPKGVMIEHSSAVNLLLSMRTELDIQEKDAILALTTIGFDIAALELFLPLVSGAKTVLLSEETCKDGERLSATISQRQISIIQATPASWHMLLDVGWPGASEAKALCGGEALNITLARKIKEKVGSLWNVYGPTETTIWSTFKHVDSILDQNINNIPIGAPLANTQIYLLDEYCQLVPIGVVGEIYIGGTGVARGYLRRPELDLERFLPDPFNQDKQAKMYRTGDLARYSEEGSIEYLGRNDFQVKIRGFRIELGEIESQLTQHREVGAAVVLAREDNPGEKRLVAYFTKRSSEVNKTSQEVIADISNHLKAVLPEYMVPAQYVILQSLPSTPNGKIDRQALPAPDVCELQVNYVVPHTETERKLVAIWADLLHLKAENISTHANFLALGGHSLLAIQMKSKIKNLFGKEIKITDMIEHPNIFLLAQTIDSLPVSTFSLIPSIEDQQYYEVSFKQKTDWMANQISRARNYPSLCVQIERNIENIDLLALQKTLDILIMRYEILRTELYVINSQLKQKICSAFSYSLGGCVIDLRCEENSVEMLEEIKQKERSLTFNFATFPLFSAKVVKMKDVDCFLFTIDHICGDYQFFYILFKDFVTIYDAVRKNEVPVLSNVLLDYKSYARWECEQLNGDPGKKHRDYWKNLIGQHDYPTFSRYFSDYDPPVIHSYRKCLSTQIDQLDGVIHPYFYSGAYGAIVNAYNEPQKSAKYIFPIDTELFEALQALCVRENVLLSSVIIAALHIMLHKLTGKEKVLIGILAEGRVKDELLEVGGCLINHIFSVGDITGDMFVSELISTIQKQMQESDEHKIYPFPKLLSEIDRSIDSLGLMELNYISLKSDEDLPKFEAIHEQGGFGMTDLNLAMNTYKNGIKADCNYRCSVFSSKTVESIMQYFVEILREIGHGQNLKIEMLPNPTIARKLNNRQSILT